MSTRIQVIVSEEERERFSRRAEREGLSLSAWMRAAAVDRLRDGDAVPRSLDDLRSFWARCDAREEGREPDWEEHLEVIARSRGSGASDS